MVGNENYEFETNQQYLGFEALFRGHVITDWFGSNFGTKKYYECNEVLTKVGVKFYNEC